MSLAYKSVIYILSMGCDRAQLKRILLPMQEKWVQSLGWEDPLKEMATRSNIFSWEFPRTEEPGRLKSTGSQNSWTQLIN